MGPGIWSLLLAITLTPLGWIQWRQYRMLDDVSTNQVDSIMWQAYQLERELSPPGHALMEALKRPARSTLRTAGTLRGLLSRIDLLTKIPRRDLLEPRRSNTPRP
jgi:two-component system, sensor histidine kinase